MSLGEGIKGVEVRGMGQVSLHEIFQTYVNGKSIFKNKDVLSIRFTPENIPHREAQIKQVALILAPVLRNERPSNVFVYGKTGTGKTLSINHVLNNLLETARKTNGHKIKTIYINCKMRKVADTEYRLLAQIISGFGQETPYTGLPTDKLYQTFFSLLDSEEQNLILVLDEVDSLIEKAGDDVLYNLTRVNQDPKKSKVTIIGISNNISFIDNLDPRIKSSLSEEEIIFPPYNATELKDILTERVTLAFGFGIISNSVIAKCAAFAAQEHGDARKALDLLRVAGELAEREKVSKVTDQHVDLAEMKLDTDRILETIRAQPKQSQAVFLSILRLSEKGMKDIQTGDIYDLYMQVCNQNGIKSLTQRRISDLISELDLFGLINAKVISKGRYGRTREISIKLSNEMLEKIKNHLNKEFL